MYELNKCMRWVCDRGMCDVRVFSAWMTRKTNVQNELKFFTNGSLV